MSSRSWLALLVFLVLAIGFYIVYEERRDDVEIELPDIDIDNR